jgi:hypothetical protein
VPGSKAYGWMVISRYSMRQGRPAPRKRCLFVATDSPQASSSSGLLGAKNSC